MNIKIYTLCMGIILAQGLSIQAADLASELASTSILCGTSFFSPRSQSTDAARDLVGWHRFIHRYNECGLYSASSFTIEYARSFRPHRLAEYFFGTDLLTITGSEDLNRSQDDMLADYFGLSQKFSSVVNIKPIMQNVIADFGFYVGYHDWYFKVHAPAVWTTAQMRLLETVKISGSDTPYPAGYMDVGAVQAPYTLWAAAMRGTSSYGDVQALKYGKIACGQLCKRGLSEIQTALGYDLVNRENGHAGFNLRLSLPTGSRPDSEFLFEPIVGNGKHWEAGIGFTGKVIVFEEDGNQRADFFADINAMHIFKARQRRSFDFIQNGFGSRYILLKQFDSDRAYTGVTLPAINITTLDCKVWNAIQFDLVFMFGYQYNNFNFDIGYNGWIRSAEKICILGDPFVGANYAFKGIQNVNAPSNATQSTATIIGNEFIYQAVVADANPPVFIQPNSLNPDSAASPLQFTNTIFWHFSHAWCTKPTDSISPFIGAGGKVEFEGVRPKCVRPNKNSMSQWGFWVKGGAGW